MLDIMELSISLAIIAYSLPNLLKFFFFDNKNPCGTGRKWADSAYSGSEKLLLCKVLDIFIVIALDCIYSIAIKPNYDHISPVFSRKSTHAILGARAAMATLSMQ
ncbi:hypothetical protein H8356DRAFT_1353570 [Neocallimastix lanati (nom. inval.)]|nr:hypothetical protein H8356DRAFT_1353570 [Neocallimastix sp. JGI-2020a]